jgi:hypothetical protein
MADPWVVMKRLVADGRAAVNNVTASQQVLVAYVKGLQEQRQITKNHDIFREDLRSGKEYGSHLRRARFESRIATGKIEVSSGLPCLIT